LRLVHRRRFNPGSAVNHLSPVPRKALGSQDFIRLLPVLLPSQAVNNRCISSGS
jgi:hypothetical protein